MLAITYQLHQHAAYSLSPSILKAGAVLQDKKASDSFENAMTVMQINPILKTAMRQLKGIRLQQTDEEVELVLLSRFSWFKVATYAQPEAPCISLCCKMGWGNTRLTEARHHLAVNWQSWHKYWSWYACSFMSVIHGPDSL